MVRRESEIEEEEGEEEEEEQEQKWRTVPGSISINTSLLYNIITGR